MGNGQALLFEAREKCSRLLAVVDATDTGASAHADASPAAQLLLQQEGGDDAEMDDAEVPRMVEADWLGFVCVRPQITDAQRQDRITTRVCLFKAALSLHRINISKRAA